MADIPVRDEQATLPAGPRPRRRTGRTATVAVPPLYKNDPARRIDRVIDYFGGAWTAARRETFRAYGTSQGCV